MDPEVLLQHGEFLRALARSLIADEHQAEDVVQATWLAALERPPRHEGALRAWLARVTRNFAHVVQRTEIRRRARERAAARPESVCAEDLLAREAVRRAVVDAAQDTFRPVRSFQPVAYCASPGGTDTLPASTLRSVSHG